MATERKPVMVYLDEETLRWVDKYCNSSGITRKDPKTGKEEARLGTGLLKIVRLYFLKYYGIESVPEKKQPYPDSGIDADRLNELEKRIVSIEEKDRDVDFYEVSETANEIFAEAIVRELTPTLETVADLQKQILELAAKLGELTAPIEASISRSETKATESIEQSTIPESESTILIEEYKTPRYQDRIVPHEELDRQLDPELGRWQEKRWAIEEYYPDYSFRGWIGGKSGIVEKKKEYQTYGRKHEAQRKCNRLNNLAPNRIFKIVPVMA